MDSSEKTKQEVQKKYFELQALDQQIKQIEQNIGILEKQLLEIGNLAENIEEIKKMEKNSKMFSPIGPGIYIESELKDTSEILVNIGSNTMVKKKPDEAKKILLQQKEELQKILETIKIELNNHHAKFQELQASINELSANMIESPKNKPESKKPSSE